MSSGTEGTEVGLNIEFWFRQLYELFSGGTLPINLAEIWSVITWVGYALTVLGFFMIVYATMRLFQLRHQEEEELGKVIIAPGTTAESPRWKHIESLMESKNASDWRQAIIEADIMLDDMLTRQGHSGAGVGEKLKQVESSDFSTLNDAWEAHKIRNEIAHAGSTFNFSETLARRTIARYESVFREFGGI